MDCKCQECEYRFRSIEKVVEASSREIEKLKDSKEKSNQDIAILCEQVKNLCDKVDDLTERIDILTRKDGESFDRIKWLVITAVVTAIMGFILGKIGL